MVIKTFKISKKLIIVLTIIVVLLSSIAIFYSFATDNSDGEEKKDFIKWVDFNVTAEALKLTAKLDIDSHNQEGDTVYNWIELLAYLSCQNGGDFKNFKEKDLTNLVEKLKNGQTKKNMT